MPRKASNLQICPPLRNSGPRSGVDDPSRLEGLRSDPTTEARLPLHRGARFLLDTQRLWHVVVHNGTAPRYALISSFESGPALDAWVHSQLP